MSAIGRAPSGLGSLFESERSSGVRCEMSCRRRLNIANSLSCNQGGGWARAKSAARTMPSPSVRIILSFVPATARFAVPHAYLADLDVRPFLAACGRHVASIELRCNSCITGPAQRLYGTDHGQYAGCKLLRLRLTGFCHTFDKPIWVSSTQFLSARLNCSQRGFGPLRNYFPRIPCDPRQIVDRESVDMGLIYRDEIHIGIHQRDHEGHAAREPVKFRDPQPG